MKQQQVVGSWSGKYSKGLCTSSLSSLKSGGFLSSCSDHCPNSKRDAHDLNHQLA